MKSTRLNKDMRSAIHSAFMQCWVSSNPEPTTHSLVTIEDAFARGIIDREAAIKGVDFSKIPEEYLRYGNYIQVSINDGDSYSYKHFYDKDGSRCIYFVPRKDGAYLVDSNDPLYLRYKTDIETLKELNQDHRVWLDKKEKVSDDVRMALDSVNSTGQLITLWPEVEQFIPDTIADFSRIQLPAISFAELNKAAGL